MRGIRVSSCFAVMGIALLSSVALAGPARFEEFSYTGHSPDQLSVGADQYSNPILSGYYPDPAITRVGENYFLINSSFAHFPGIPVFTSKDLINWTQIANAIDRPDQLNLAGRAVSEGVFAPDISFHDGVYYIVNTCVGCKGNFVITAKNPAGPWSAPIWISIEGIDPSLFWEGDKAYVVNNRAPSETPLYAGHRAIWIQEYDWRAGKMIGEAKQIVDGGVDISKKPSWIEGPHLLRHGSFYYLIAAQGGTGENHSEVVFRSESLFGPYLPSQNNPILSQRGLDPNRPSPITSSGHADFVETQNGEWWAVFLATRPYQDGLYNTGRETFMLPVTWTNDWPSILPAQQPIPNAVKKPDLPNQPKALLPTSGDISYVEHFDSKSLGLQWIGLRTPQTPLYRLERGALVLNGGAAIGDKSGVPAFIARRQQNSEATIATVLRYTPERDGDRAGLVALQSDSSYLFFGVTKIDGKQQIALYTRDHGAETMVATADLTEAGKPVTLTLQIDGGRISFDYMSKDGRHTLCKDLDATFLSSRKAGGFTGTVIGPYAFKASIQNSP